MRQLLPISSLLLASFGIVFGNGVAGLLLPARADAEGWSTDVIAMIGASYALFFTLGCLIVPRLVARVGHIRAFAALGTLTVSSMLLHAMEPTAWFWIVVRGMAGFSIAGAYMIIESWMNEETSNEERGLAFAVYMVVGMGGMALGPFVVSAGDVRGFELFAWAALIYLFSTLPVILTAARSPSPLTTVSLNLPALYRNSPAAFVGSILTGAIVGTWLSLFPVWGLEVGLGTTAIAVIISVSNVGAMALQIPIGRLSDKIDRRLVMVLVGAVGAGIGLIAPVVPVGGWPFAVLMFAYGGVLFGAYSLNAAHANDWARDVSFVTVASGLLVLYGIGATVAPLIAGRFMASVGPSAMFAFLAACHAVYAGFALWRITRRGDLPSEAQTDFKALPIARATTPETFALDPRAEDGGSERWNEVDYAVAGEA